MGIDQTDPNIHPFVKISAQWTEYTAMDTDNLRTAYRRNVLRGGRSFFAVARDKMIAMLLEEQFGKKILIEYIKQCQEWDAMEQDFYRNADRSKLV
jgi:hypothetical protein